MEKDENQDVELEQENDEQEEVETSEEDNEEVDESKEDSTDWEAEAKKWKAIANRNKKKQEKPAKKLETDDQPDLRQDVEFLKQSEKKRAFGYEHQLSPEETDKIFQINPNPTADTLKDPFVKAGLEALRRKNRVDDNTPSSSTKSNPVLTKKFKEMNPHERNAQWQKFMQEKGVLK